MLTSSSVGGRRYATTVSTDDRRLRTSTGDSKAEVRAQGHPDEPTSILDTSTLPPTGRTRSIGKELDSTEITTQSLESEVNTHLAARNDGTIPPPSSAPPKDPVSLPTTFPKDFSSYRAKIRRQSRLGTNLIETYDPLTILHNPPTPEKIGLPLLLANQTHLGHHTSLWHPGNSSYIFGVREGIHIISLDITYAYLLRAAKIIQDVARLGGVILFVGTRKGQEQIIVRAAQRAKGYHIFDRWVPGTLTNGQQLLGDCAVKAVNVMDQELEQYRGVLSKRLHQVIRPDLVVCVNPLENEVCLHECGLFNVPTIGIVDTDANPAWVTYPVPANDDSLRSVGLVAGVLSQAAATGQSMRMAQAKEGKASYDFKHVAQRLKATEHMATLEVSESTEAPVQHGLQRQDQ